MDEEIDTAAEKEVLTPVTYKERIWNAIVQLDFKFKCCCCNQTFNNGEEALANHLTSQAHVERIQPYTAVVIDLDEWTCEDFFREQIVISLPSLLKKRSDRPRGRSFCYRCCDLLTDGIDGVTQHIASKRHKSQRSFDWINRCDVCMVVVDSVNAHEKRAFHRAVLEDYEAYGIEADAAELAQNLPEVPQTFVTRKEYFEFWEPAVDAEEKNQKAFLESCEMWNVKVRWVQVRREEWPRAYFVPKDSDALLFRLRMGDDLKISLSEPKKWVGRGRVVQMPNFDTNEACIKLEDGRGLMEHVTEGYSTIPIWNDAIIRRMRAALKRMMELDVGVGSKNEYLVDVLLNRVQPGVHYKEPDVQFDHATERIVPLPDGKRPTAAQLTAVSTGMRQRLSLVEGPPGTGKTTAIVMLVYNVLVQQERLKILVCAQSNAAVDLLAVELNKVGLRVVRLFSSRYAVGNNDSPAHRLGFVRQLFEYDPELRQDYDRFINKRMKGEERALYKSKLDAAKAEVWAAAQVTCCTCISAGSSELRGQRYAVLVIDEASRATEPECLVPLVTRGAPRVVLVGDDNQLGPVVISRIGRGSKLGRSLFERLKRQPDLAKTTLDVQFRMHPLLAKFPFAKFYRGRWESGVDESEREMRFAWLRGDKPLVFVDVENTEEEEGSRSFSNEREADYVIELLCKVIESGIVGPKDIGVITPYEKQRRLLRDKIRRMIKAEESNKLGRKLSKTEIANVDSFYGREKDLVVVSFVRSCESTDIGFLEDPRRLNTTLTRARYKLILVGHRKTLFTANYMYTELIEFVDRFGLTIHV